MEKESRFSHESEQKPLKTLTFLGRNTEGILSDAKTNLEELGEINVIARDGDKLEAPSGLQKTGVSDFTPDQNFDYIIIANGGTSQQLLPTIKKLVEQGIKFKAYDLQRDGVAQVMETPSIKVGEKELKEREEKEPQLILFLGNNTEGILNDALKQFGRETKAMVISRENDRLQPPEGLQSETVGTFEPEEGKKYIVIANGGTSQQLLPVISKLLEKNIPFEAWDLQRDGANKVW